MTVRSARPICIILEMVSVLWGVVGQLSGSKRRVGR